MSELDLLSRSELFIDFALWTRYLKDFTQVLHLVLNNKHLYAKKKGQIDTK